MHFVYLLSFVFCSSQYVSTCFVRPPLGLEYLELWCENLDGITCPGLDRSIWRTERNPKGRSITLLYAWTHRYQFRPFPNEKSIRLLKIEKDPDSSQPFYSFEIFPIDAHPEYYALSYSYGKAVEGEKDTRNHYFLRCGSSYIRIGKNLTDFLLV